MGVLAWNFERGEAGRAQILAQNARAAFAHDVDRPGHWKGGDGKAARHRFNEHNPERVGA